MEQIIPFQKDIVFKTKVSEITSISLEHTLKLEDEMSIAGEFEISGTYKMSDVSKDEDFHYTIPFDIVLDHRYRPSDLVIDIDDFYYEIIDSEVLRVHIDVYVSGEELLVEDLKEKEALEEQEVVREEKQEEVPEERQKEVLEEPNDVFKEMETKNKKEIEERAMENEIVMPQEVIPQETETETEVNTLFQSVEQSEDKYVSYHVHIVRNDETLETIMAKYSVSLENLESYNDLNNMTVGTKLIIPSSNEA